MSADSDLDYAVLEGDIALADKLSRTKAAPDKEQADKLLAMAALSRSLAMLEFVHRRYQAVLDRSRAFAYALNQGFSDGMLYLYERGALDDARAWMRHSAQFRRYKMRYLLSKGRLFFDVGTDFFGYVLTVYSLENMLGARGIELASAAMRCEAVAALADADAVDDEMYYEYATRALLFDECPIVDALGEHGGFDFARVFGAEPISTKNYWVHPGMSPRKVELVESAMPDGYAFPLAPRFLTDLDTVRALVPRSSAQACTAPELLVGYLIAHGCTEELAMVQDWGGITADNIDAHIELAQERSNAPAVALLLDHKKRRIGNDPFGELSADAL